MISFFGFLIIFHYIFNYFSNIHPLPLPPPGTIYCLLIMAARIRTSDQTTTQAFDAFKVPKAWFEVDDEGEIRNTVPGVQQTNVELLRKKKINNPEQLIAKFWHYNRDSRKFKAWVRTTGIPASNADIMATAFRDKFGPQ